VTVASRDLYLDGVRIEIYGEPSDSPPLLFVHGGNQGSWAWEKIAPRLAEDGFYALCLNWYGHNGSSALDASTALTRSMLDVTTEIAIVAEPLSRPPVLIAHSMGAIPALAYAAAEAISGLVLLTPTLPAGFGADVIELDVTPSSLYTPPLGMLKPVWWDGVTDEESQRYTSLLSPESPRAVLEATRWLCEVETSNVHVPALVLAAGADQLLPAAQVELLADAIGATFLVLEGEGHGVVVNPVWTQVAAHIRGWLSRLQLATSTRPHRAAQ
jgi:pimeloyl-ACP methyl ester carboxylesterase